MLLEVKFIYFRRRIYFKSSIFLFRAHEILLLDEKQDGIKFDCQSKGQYVTNFSKVELDRFKNEEHDEECTSCDETFVSFDKSLRLRVRSPVVKSQNTREINELVMTETGQKNLNKLVMSIVTDCCVMVEGELSTGKTSLIENLSSQTNNKLIKYQMDEYMDSKVVFLNLFVNKNLLKFIISPHF